MASLSRPSRPGRADASARRTAGFAARGVAASLFVVLLPTVAGAQPTQSIGSLQERARKVAAELDELDRRTNDLDEQFNNATLQLEALKAELADNQAQVDSSRQQLDANRDQAQSYAVQAYIGSADPDSDMFGVSDDATVASQRRTFLAARYGDSEAVVDDLVAAQKDLADEEADLEAANAQVDAKLAEIDRAKDQLEATIADRHRLADSINGELERAVKAEQARREAEAEAKAKAEADAAAARAAAARRAPAVSVRVSAQGGVGTSGASTPAVAVVSKPAASPPPSDAPVAVRVALEQQGDPYKWAAAGPDAFDCSGLVMFAYRAAGVSLPHSSRSLRSMTQSISADELQPGDLVFGGSPVHHVGIYVGDGQMVHAPHSGDVVKVSSIYSTSKPVSFGRL